MASSADDSNDPAMAPRTFGTLERVFLAAIVALGALLRAVVLRGDLGALDSDEAVAGLMGLSLLRDHHVSTFFWGQSYGGALEPYVALPGLALFRGSPLALKLTTVVLAAVCAYVAWRLARRCIAPFAAACVGLVVWLGPGPYLWWSTKPRGFYWATLLCGLVALLMIARVIDRAGSQRWNWFAMGLAAGLGWWSSPQILFLVLPGALWLWLRRSWTTAGFLTAAGASVFGASPWLVFNARHRLASAHGGPQTSRGVWGNVSLLFREGLPRAFGLNNTLGYVETLAPFVLLGALVLLVISALHLHRRPHPLAIMSLAVVVVLWGWIPAFGTTGEGRYVLCLVPLVVLGVMSVATRVVAAVFVVLLAATTIAWIDNWHGLHQLGPDVAVPTHVGALINTLEKTPDACILADYWIAYRVEFESDRKIVAAPTAGSRAPASDRACLAREHHLFVMVSGSAVSVPASVDQSRRIDVGGFTVFG